MRVYHQRSNVEAVFQMVKQHFTDKLSTETPGANDLEVKLLFVCHNILRLIHKIREEDIKLDFSSCAKNKLAVQKTTS